VSGEQRLHFVVIAILRKAPQSRLYIAYCGDCLFEIAADDFSSGIRQVLLGSDFLSAVGPDTEFDEFSFEPALLFRVSRRSEPAAALAQRFFKRALQRFFS
jgi:hypothetical protein